MEIGHGIGQGHVEPGMAYVDGEGRLFDLNIAVALLSLDGAAWDGNHEPAYEPADDEPDRRAAWQAMMERPEGRRIHVEHVGDHRGTVMETVIRKDGWTAPDGTHYEPGQLAPMPRVCYHLRGEYHYFREGYVVRRLTWNHDDFKFWFRQWFKNGGLLQSARFRVELREKLLDLNRDKYGIASTLRAAGK